MNDGMIYSKSSMPAAATREGPKATPKPAAPSKSPEQEPAGPASPAAARYPSMAGSELIELPRERDGKMTQGLDSNRTVERMKIDEIPRFVIERVNAAIDENRDASLTFAHHIGSLQGSELLDKRTSREADKLLAQFSHVEGVPARRTFLEKRIRPFFEGLRPAQRPADSKDKP